MKRLYLVGIDEYIDALIQEIKKDVDDSLVIIDTNPPELNDKRNWEKVKL